jgi:hypothetical protein
LCFHKAPPIGQTVHRNVPNNTVVMGNKMLKFHNDSSNFAQVRAPTNNAPNSTEENSPIPREPF